MANLEGRLLDHINGNRAKNGFITIPVNTIDTAVSIKSMNHSHAKRVVMVRTFPVWKKVRLFLETGDRVRVEKDFSSLYGLARGVSNTLEYEFDGSRLIQVNLSEGKDGWWPVTDISKTHCSELYKSVQDTLFGDVYPALDVTGVGITRVIFKQYEDKPEVSSPEGFLLGLNVADGVFNYELITVAKKDKQYDCRIAVEYVKKNAIIRFTIHDESKMDIIREHITEQLNRAFAFEINSEGVLHVYNFRGKSFGWLTT